MIKQKNKKTISRYNFTRKQKNKTIRKEIKVITKSLQLRTLKKQQKGGGEVVPPEGFWNKLSRNIQQNIQKELFNLNYKTDNLETIKSNKLIQTSRLYDFIFQNQKLFKIWDHAINNPSSITAGLPGIHIYVILNNNQHQIVGTFIRSS
jgi:hypothetical protein